MKFPLTPLFLCCLIGGSGALFGQSSREVSFKPPIYNSVLHISTDNGTYKGRILEMTDTTISIMQLKDKSRLDIPARLIYTIKVKKRFFRSVFIDFCLGTTAATFFILCYYLPDAIGNPGYPPFGKVLLGGMAIGAGGGILYGMAESTFFRIRIPIDKNLGNFQVHRRKLLKFWLED